MKGAKIRLYVDHPLGAGQTVALTRDQAHYLFGVMRLRQGDAVLLFNGHDGEWRAEVAEIGKKGGALSCAAQTAPLRMPPDLWLVFAPIKKARTDFIVEKAAELGAARILPVQTEFTNSERIRRDRLQAHAVEAAEQCGGTFVPEVAEIQRLDRLLDRWPEDRTLWFCDETLAGPSSWEKYSGGQGGIREAAKGPADHSSDKQGGTRSTDGPPPSAILIGPEGGFSDAERARLRRTAKPVSLGPRILRADTAAVAALTLWQMKLGDWR